MARLKFVYTVLVSISILSWIYIITFSVLPSKSQKLINYVPPAERSSLSASSPATTAPYIIVGGCGGGGGYDKVMTKILELPYDATLGGAEEGAATLGGAEEGAGIPRKDIIYSNDNPDYHHRFYPIK